MGALTGIIDIYSAYVSYFMVKEGLGNGLFCNSLLNKVEMKPMILW